MLLILCNKPLLFDLFLAASAFWRNALFDPYRIPGTGIYAKYLFFSQNSVSLKWFWNCQIGAGDWNALRMEIQEKHQTGNSLMSLHLSLFLYSQSSSFSSSSSSECSLFSSLFFYIQFYFLKHQPSGAFTLNWVTVAAWEVMSDSLWNKRHPITVSSVPQLLHSRKRH